MVPARNSQVTLQFTVGQLVEACGNILKAAEKRAQARDCWEFVCRFRDRSGILVGAFSKDKPSEIVELVIFGKGHDWSIVVSRAIDLAIRDQKLARTLDSQLHRFDETWQREKVIEEGGITFELVHFGDGQMLVKVNPVREKQTTGAPRRAAKVRTSTVKAVSPLSLAFAHDIPMFDIELLEFKERFDKWVRLNSPLDEDCQSDLSADGDTITIMLPKRTFLEATTFDGRQLTGVSIEGRTKGITELWFCVEAVLSALDPGMPKSRFLEIIGEFERKGSKPHYTTFEDFELDTGEVSITYRCERKSRSLFIRPRDR